ncbi:MAG: AAA family ATPase [Lachnospirales bacterium]
MRRWELTGSEYIEKMILVKLHWMEAIEKMEYCVLEKDKNAGKIAEQVITLMLQEYSRQLFGLTRAEFDSIVEYDVLNIMASFYTKINAQQKKVIVSVLQEEFSLCDLESVLENLAMYIDDKLYMPLSCKLIDKLGDSRVTTVVYETLFKCCSNMLNRYWNQSNSYSNYLVLLNVGFFNALSYKLHIRDSYSNSMYNLYEQTGYDEFVESLYEKHLDDIGWDADVELDVIDELIKDSKINSTFDNGTQEEYMYAVETMKNICREHVSIIHKENEVEGFTRIVKKTGIRELKNMDIQGFECHFCEAKFSDEKYIIVYQNKTHINEIIDKEDKWSKFQKELYYDDIRQDNSKAMVYIVYILDDNSDNIPIQIIESNKTYGRKYVFSEDETITFINGIVKTSSEEIGAASPVQEWDHILREEHLTACLTESYAAKKVENYLSGQRFDADYVQDDDYSSMNHSEVPQIKWVKSLDTTGFRDFCFDKKNMTFGQINLFYGANGSGKTSVLEAIEYALTSEVRRVKDFKVKMPTDSYPKLHVYDTEAGVHTFTPGFSKKNNKEIERVWYGVPIGRTKSNLNENFNRFNAFDSEAAYKFIHESDNSEDSFASMFGNLMFGETVVDHEKKWQRFKRAFNERYTELRSELSEARSMAQIYEDSLANKTDNSKSEEIEKGIITLQMRCCSCLPKGAFDRYSKILEEMKSIRKYVDVLSAHNLEDMTFESIAMQTAETKKRNLLYTRQRKDKSEKITKLTEENGIIKKKIFDEGEKQTEIQQRIDRVNIDINNWAIVQNVLSNKETIELVNNLLSELTQIEKELYYISKIEQKPVIIKFLKLDDYEELSDEQKQKYEEELNETKEKRRQIENRYNEEKKAFGEKEQQAIELRKIGKTLVTDAKCPLCGQEYDSTQQLVNIIDSAVVIDDKMDALISELQKLGMNIIELEKILDRQQLIDKAKKELLELKIVVPMVEKCGSDYNRLYDYVVSRTEKEKRKKEIIEQQTALDNQGFSVRNINACREYTSTDSTYLEYKNVGKGTYAEFLQSRLQQIQNELALSEGIIADQQKKIQQNEQAEELLRNEIHTLESQIEALDVDTNRNIEQALETLKTKYELKDEEILEDWISIYHTVYDKSELEVERLESENSIVFERQMLKEYKATIKRTEPMVERCARAVQAFEKMPSLSSFVENGIRSNIQQISKFFKWMHHSGEFEKLDIDDKGIYAVRGLNKQEVRTYEMSTGQRSTIAMAVMFALHMAAPNAPQFLLLDEPLATMDDTQVLNVLDILKSMAEQDTQIFFTTANGIMINLFKECFKNTTFDYKEYQFVKRVNRPSEIKESSINDTKSIEELTLDDLTLDFHQFEQIRNILRKNQEKLVAREEWEELQEEAESVSETGAQVQPQIIQEEQEYFYMILESEERRVLDVLVADQPESVATFLKLVSPFPNYKIILERINEKALDFYEETVINSDEMLPYVEEDYLAELKEQHDAYYDKNPADLMIEEQRRFAEEKSAQLEDKLKKSETERQRLEEERLVVEARRVMEETERTKAAEAQKRAEEQRLRLEDELKKTGAARQQLEAERKKEEELRKAEEERSFKLEEELRKTIEKSRQQEDQRKAEEERKLEELQKAEVAKAKQQAEQQKKRYRQMNVCQYCGGSFKGLFSKKCKVCGRPKDYA